MDIRKSFWPGKTAVAIGAIIIALLFVSYGTAVPQVQGSAVVERLDKVEMAKSLHRVLSKDIDINSADHYRSTLNSAYILAVTTEQIILSVKNPDNSLDISTIQKAVEKSQTQKIDEKHVISKTQDCINALSITIDEIFSEKNQGGQIASKMLKKCISMMHTLVKPDNAELSVNYEPGTLLEIIIIIIAIILQILAGIIAGIINGIVALVKLIVLILAGVQIILTIIASFIIFMGILSMSVLKLVTTIFAPIFAYIAEKIIPVIGVIFGALVLATSAVLALALLLAIPIAIIVVILVILGEELADVLAPILEAIFRVILSILPQLEEFLRSIWEFLGQIIENWPPWPF